MSVALKMFVEHLRIMTELKIARRLFAGNELKLALEEDYLPRRSASVEGNLQPGRI